MALSPQQCRSSTYLSEVCTVNRLTDATATTSQHSTLRVYGLGFRAHVGATLTIRGYYYQLFRPSLMSSLLLELTGTMTSLVIKVNLRLAAATNSWSKLLYSHVYRSCCICAETTMTLTAAILVPPCLNGCLELCCRNTHLTQSLARLSGASSQA